VGIMEIKNKMTGWSFQRKEPPKCVLCKTEIGSAVYYEVFDDKGDSKGPHHYACAERAIRS